MCVCVCVCARVCAPLLAATIRIYMAHQAREDFVFYSERLMRLLMEFANGFLPHEPIDVNTACGRMFSGQKLTKPVVGISILRSGLAMESSLRSVHRGAPLGKILIQTNKASGEPELHYCKLPDVQNSAIIVMEPTIATGAAVRMFSVARLWPAPVQNPCVLIAPSFSRDLR